MAITLPIEPAVLAWARETAGYSIEAAADRLHVPKERLQAWEAGEVRPGISHLRRLASVYRRPLPALFLAEPPKEPPDPADFRTIGSRAAGFSPQTRFAIRDARRWRQIASDIAEDQGWLGDVSLPNISLGQQPESVANSIREWLGVVRDVQIGWPSAREAFNSWRRAIEDKYVLVFVLPMPRSDCRGFSLWEDHTLPAIVVNSQEVPEARSFTLLHELTHLMLRNTGVCDQVGSGNGHREIETFCNQVAGFVLLPRQMLAGIVRTASRGPEMPTSEELTEYVRRRCRTSRHVAAIRLEEDAYVPPGTYDDLLVVWSAEDWREASEGGPVPLRYRVLSEKGALYSTLLIQAWRDGTLTSLEVSRLMELKAPRLEEVASQLAL